jgi:GNAT superfamily N-acetyltransferase
VSYRTNSLIVKEIGRKMRFFEAKDLSQKQKLEIVDLWNCEYPKLLNLGGLPEFDIYLDTLSDKHHILLCDEDDSVKGWLIYFLRDDERCFAMLLDSGVQGQGMGSEFLRMAKERNSELNGWVIAHDTELKKNGEFYISPIEFYRKNGFEIRRDIQLKKENINGIKVIWRLKRTKNG